MLNHKRNNSSNNKDSSQSWLEWIGNQKKCAPWEEAVLSHTSSNTNHKKNPTPLYQLFTFFGKGFKPKAYPTA